MSTLQIIEQADSKLIYPTNKKLGSFFGLDESTVRNWKKSKPDFYSEQLTTYRLDRSPFITEDEYKRAFNDSITSDISARIKNREIPGILDSEGNILYPVNMQTILDNTNEIRKSKETNVLSFSNFKGGVGKTTTAVNIATVLAFYGLNVLIIDLDIQANTTSLFDLYHQDFDKTIVDLMYLVEDDNIDEIIRSSVVSLNDRINSIGKLNIIPNSSNLVNAEKFDAFEQSMKTYGNINQILDEVLSYVKDDYDFIIIDTPPSIGLPLRLSILATDYFIVVLQPDKMAKDGMPSFIKPIQKNAKAYKKHKNKDIVVLGGVMNLYQDNLNIHQANLNLIDEELVSTVENNGLGESKLFETKIKRSSMLIEAQNKNGSLLYYEPTSELVRDYFNLTDEIIESIIIDKLSKLEEDK